MLKICTSNHGKAVEIGRILNLEVEPVKLALTEIQAIDPAAVSRAKAAQAYAQISQPVIVDDTGLGLVSLGGFPGALIAWVLDSGGVELVHRMVVSGASSAAVATTVIGYADDQGVEIFVGEVRGAVLAAPRGEGGFGFDPIFVPYGASKTFAEMDDQEKDACSPRRLALEQLSKFLETR